MSPVVAGGYTDVQILAEEPEEPGVYRVGHGAGHAHALRGGLGEGSAYGLLVGALGRGLTQKVVTNQHHLRHEDICNVAYIPLNSSDTHVILVIGNTADGFLDTAAFEGGGSRRPANTPVVVVHCSRSGQHQAKGTLRSSSESLITLL